MAPRQVTQPELIIANKIKIPREQALELAHQAKQVWVSKGKKLLRLPSATTSDEELAKHILGRSGTLRAPALMVGEVFAVGFHLESYQELFG